MSVEQNIFAGFKTAIESTTPTTDENQPSAFKALESLDSMHETPEERSFTVRRARGNALRSNDVTGLRATGQYDLRVEVELCHENKALDDITFEGLCAEDTRRVIDGCLVYFRTSGNVAGVDGIILEDVGINDSEDEDSRKVYTTFSFVVKYRETIIPPTA